MSTRSEHHQQSAAQGPSRDGNGFGGRLRAARERREIGVRELSRQIDVSPSMISQIELGRVMPSVKTLYAMTNVLGISVDELLAAEQAPEDEPGKASALAEVLANAQAAQVAVAPPPTQPQAPVEARSSLVQRAATRKTLTLGSGVRWELLNSIPDPEVEFQQAIYEPGSESGPADALIRHGGHEYGLVLDGRLGVTVAFETYELEPGDSISFDSSLPHRLFNVAEQPTTVIWVVVGRRADHRVTGAG